MIKNLVIHIGDPKTGTSSIQDALQAQACSCPDVTIAPQKELNGSALANCLIPDRSPDAYETRWQEKARWMAQTDADLGIISAEFFAGVVPGALDRALREFLPGHADRTRIIAYVRPHASQVLSNFGQRTKAGSFTGKLSGLLSGRDQRERTYFHPRFSRWRDVFGDRFTLRPFIREELRDQDVTADFFHAALDGRPFALAPQDKTNESVTLQELVAFRILQSTLRKQDVPRYLRLSLGGAMGRRLATLPGRARIKPLLDRDSAEIIRDAYLEDARALDGDFFGRSLMEPALHMAVDTAIAQPQSVRPRDYYPQEDIDRLRDLATQLAEKVTAMPHAWRTQYQVSIGQRPAEEAEPLNRKQKRNAAAVWDLQEQIVQIMIPASAG